MPREIANPDYDMQVLAEAAEITKSEHRVRRAIGAAEKQRDAAARFIADNKPAEKRFNRAPKNSAFKFKESG